MVASVHSKPVCALDQLNSTSKSKILRILKKGNIGITNMHKKHRRQDRDPGWLGHIPAR